MQKELDSSRAEILSIARGRVVGFGADVRQQAREQGAVDHRVARGVDGGRQFFAPRPAQLGDLLGKLPVQITPFAQAQIGHKMRPAVLDQAAMRQLVGKRIGKELPQGDQA